MNFPMQASDAAMTQLAAIAATERGLQVCAPVHDAFLVMAPLDGIEGAVAELQAIMREASVVVGGVAARTEAEIVRFPDRYVYKRGDPCGSRSTPSLRSTRNVKARTCSLRRQADPGIPDHQRQAGALARLRRQPVGGRRRRRAGRGPGELDQARGYRLGQHPTPALGGGEPLAARLRDAADRAGGRRQDRADHDVRPVLRAWAQPARSGQRQPALAAAWRAAAHVHLLVGGRPGGNDAAHERRAAVSRRGAARSGRPPAIRRRLRRPANPGRDRAGAQASPHRAG